MAFELFADKQKALADVVAAAKAIEDSLAFLSRDEAEALAAGIKSLVDGHFGGRDRELVSHPDRHLPSPTKAVEDLLSEHPHGLSPAAVVARLFGRIATKSGDPKRIIYTTLSVLTKRGRVLKDEDGLYRLSDS